MYFILKMYMISVISTVCDDNDVVKQSGANDKLNVLLSFVIQPCCKACFGVSKLCNLIFVT